VDRSKAASTGCGCRTTKHVTVVNTIAINAFSVKEPAGVSGRTGKGMLRDFVRYADSRSEKAQR
jgi:hypothetical protein